MNRHRPTATTVAVETWWQERQHALATTWSVARKADALGLRRSQLLRIVKNADRRKRAHRRLAAQAAALALDRAKYAAQRCIERAEAIEREWAR